MNEDYPEWKQKSRGKATFSENIFHIGSMLDRLVRIAREESGLTQRALASKIGVTHGAIAKYEDGTRGLSLEVLNSISKSTGKELGWFLSRAGYMAEPAPVTPREALNVLTELVDQHEKQQAKLVLLQGHARELAGNDPTKWPPGLFELLADEAGEEMTKEMRDIAASLEMGPLGVEQEERRSKGA